MIIPWGLLRSRRLLFAALLAAYVSRPILRLRQAMQAGAKGELSAGLSVAMGNRRDELADLGQDFGATLTETEVRWLITHEFAREPADILWRRTKLGLRMSAAQIEQLSAYMAATVTLRAISPAAE